MPDHEDLTGGPFCSCISCHISLWPPPPPYVLVLANTEDPEDPWRSPICPDCARKAETRLRRVSPEGPLPYAIITWPPPDATAQDGPQ
jgi:hypothetical protein